jgi:hypothetical protein
MHLYEVLRRPRITEKNAALQTQGKYAFEVAREANKEQVKQAVEKALTGDEAPKGSGFVGYSGAEHLAAVPLLGGYVPKWLRYQQEKQEAGQ